MTLVFPQEVVTEIGIGQLAPYTIGVNKDKISNNKNDNIKNDFILSNKGNTGREARNLIEKLTIDEVKSTPFLGKKIKLKLNDERWLEKDGWEKWSYERKNLYGHPRIEVHYNLKIDKNRNLLEIDDIKIKFPN